MSACCPLQVKAEISVDSKHQTLQGLAFPLQETAKRALQQLAQKRINYIQLVSEVKLGKKVTLLQILKQRDSLRFSVYVVLLDCCYFTSGQMHSEYCVLLLCQRLDVEKEIIELVHSNPTEIQDLPCRVPTDTPRYHFFLYKHSHEGDYLESIGMSLIPVRWWSSSCYVLTRWINTHKEE